MIAAGLDLSLTGAGVAIVDSRAPEDRMLFREGSRALPRVPAPRGRGVGVVPLHDRERRISDIADRVLSDVQTAQVQLAVVEAPSFGSKNAGAQHERSGLFWIVVGALRSVGIPVAEVPPTSRALYATGRGGADKESVVEATVARWGIGTRDNNIVDAFVLAAMGCHAFGEPLEPLVPVGQGAALLGVLWPPLNGQEEE